MEAMRIWADTEKLEKIKRLPKVFVKAEQGKDQSNLVIYNEALTKQRIIYILNDEE